MTLSPDVLDRGLGSVVGLAVGTTVEFQPRGLFPPVTDMASGGPFRLTAGQWTDDTSMALCLAGSLLYAPTRDPRDLMDRFVRWAKEGYNASTGRCFDVGRTTLSAIARFRRTGDPPAGARDPWEAGTGSIMRLAPVVARWHDPPTAERVARAQRVTTHVAAEAVDACALLARVLGTAITGSPADALAAPAQPAWCPSIPAIAAGAWRLVRQGAGRCPVHRLRRAHSGSGLLVLRAHPDLRGGAHRRGQRWPRRRHGRDGDRPDRRRAVRSDRHSATLGRAPARP